MPPPADAPLNQENTSSDNNHRLTAASSIRCAAVLFSIGPLIVHLTARDSNRFYYTALSLLLQFIVLASFLAAFRRRFLYRFLPYGSFGLKRTALCRAGRLPLVLIVIGGFDYVLFIWSTKFVATAVTTTFYELWPAFLIFGLVVYRPVHEREFTRQVTGKYRRITLEKIMLILFASVGLIFMLGSQTVDDASLSGVGPYKSILGILLALLASIIVTTNAVGSIVYGKILYYHLTGIRDPDQQNPRLLLWLSLLGVGISRPFSAIINIGLGLLTDTEGDFSLSAASGAVLAGASVVGGAILFRVGNFGPPGEPNATPSKPDPAINALFFCSPGLALVWLMAVGITIPRFDLFIVGSTLILAINALIQLKPDEERDVVLGASISIDSGGTNTPRS